MDADSALTLLGKFSRWQLICYSLISLGLALPYAWMLMAIVFIGDAPNYRCNLAPNTTLNQSIPSTIVNGVLQYDSCTMYTEPGVSNQTGPCTHGYWYDPDSGYDSTLVSEWDLVCGKEWLVEMSMSISVAGSMVGAILCTWLADKYGRKMVFLGCMWSNAVLATIQAFSPNMTFYTVLGFIDGLQQQGMMVAFVLCLELFPKDQRTFAGNAIELVYVAGYVLLTPIAYALRNWRHLQLAITLPIFLTIGLYWLLSESIPWLVLNGKPEEAEKVMQRAARWNKISIPDKIFTKSQDDQSEETKLMKDPDDVNQNVDDVVMAPIPEKKDDINDVEVKYSFIDIMKSRRLCLYILVLIPIWFVDNMGYLGISYTVTYLPGNRYVNFCLYSIIEIPGYVLAWYLTYRIGRRLSMAGCHLIAGILLIGTVLQLYDVGVDLNILVVTLSVLGKCFIAASYAILYLYSAEIFPTNARNTLMGIFAMLGHVAGLVSPFARTLHRGVPWLPPVILGILFVAGGLLSLLLPETRHRKLPSTIEEVEGWTNRKDQTSDETTHEAGTTQPI